MSRQRSNYRISKRWFVAQLLVCCLAYGYKSAIGQTTDAKLATVVDAGRVLDIARVGNTIYLGGVFTQVGPCTGQGVPVSATTGEPLDSYPRVAEEVDAVISDSNGGWFIGGAFVIVSGTTRLFLAHLLADGSLDAWNPQPNAPVETLCLSGDTLYVGGAFTTCGGASRRHGAAFDARTGQLTQWDPGANASIKTIATDGGVVYVGGQFTALDTLSRAFLGAVDRGTGAATPWNPGADSLVLALTVRGSEIYAGGYFHFMGGAPRSLIAALDATNGNVLPWSWAIVRNPVCDECDPGPFVDTMAWDGNRLYFGGSFTHVDGIPRSGAAALAMDSHGLSDWDPGLTGVAPAPYCRGIAINHGVVYLVGRFDGLKGIARPHAGAVDTNGVLVGWEPRPNAPVRCAAATSAAVYIGGEFRSVWNWQARRCLAAVNATTGEVTSWNPNPNGVVNRVRVSGNTIYVAGAFDTIAGEPRTCLAAIDATSGEATPWNPGVDAGIYPPIHDMVVSRGVVYVGGIFSGVGGQPRYCLGAVDSITGQATPWNPIVNDFVDTVAMQGDTLYVGGWFTQACGQPRNYLAAVDTGGALLGWNPDANSIVQAMTIAEGRVYLGGGFSSVGGLPRNSLAAVDCTTGEVADWAVDASFQVRALAVANHVLYVGGWFSHIGGETRNGLAAVDTRTGAVLAWDPHPKPIPDSAIWSLHVAGDELYMGGAFDYLGFDLRPGFAGLSLARGPDPGPGPPTDRPLSIAQNAPNPVRTSTTISFALSKPARVSMSVFDLTGRCIARPLREVEQAAGPHRVELGTTGWHPGIYYYRFDAGGATATRKMVVVK